MKVAVIGSGYVGLVVGACLAESGNDVIGADVDQDRVDRLNRGEVPIFEPGLERLLADNLAAGRLRFTTEVDDAVRRSAVIFIAVGTPPGEDGSADLQQVLAVARSIGEAMNTEKIVLTKSTVPVGTATLVKQAIEAHTSWPVHVCSNPEFLKEGAAVDDFMKPDRVVLGVEDETAAEVLRDLYAPFVRQGNQILLMDVASAELTKYAANAMLASRISFMNLIARICERTGADVDHVRLGVGSDIRIGTSFLFPGIGYGGSCFPKDVKALIRAARELGEDTALLDAIEGINEKQKMLLLERVESRFGSDLSGRRFGVWGLSFKPQTDDMREAPSLVTVRGLLQRGGEVIAHDPEALAEARRHFGDEIVYASTPYDAIEGADALLVLTEWHPYRHPDLLRMRALMREPVVFDGRNVFRPEKMRSLGFEYHSVGRAPVVPSRSEAPA